MDLRKGVALSRTPKIRVTPSPAAAPIFHTVGGFVVILSFLSPLGRRAVNMEMLQRFMGCEAIGTKQLINQDIKSRKNF